MRRMSMTAHDARLQKTGGRPVRDVRYLRTPAEDRSRRNRSSKIGTGEVAGAGEATVRMRIVEPRVTIVPGLDRGHRADLGDEPHPARLFRPIQSRLSACVARSGDARPASRAIAS